jgi:two-component system CheB/CheR fusion protein
MIKTKDAGLIINDSPETRLTATGTFPVVGMGASAGGLAAFEAFFSGISPALKPNMAFILIQHLAPDHKSLLPELLQRSTSMPVVEVENGMPIQPGCVYIIPPNYNMALMNGTLQLFALSLHKGLHLPIDYFFNSLAQDLGNQAIGIVLSGTGSDGTQGVKHIKQAGGMVMVQTPQSSEYDAMPRHAIETNLVDFQLKPEEMAAQLIAYTSQIHNKAYLSEALAMKTADNSIQKILVLVRTNTGHDFSGYKPNTIKRRIQRRMAANHMKTLEGYIRYLTENVAESSILFNDLLIGVTSFFRDKEAFLILEKEVLPTLFANKNADDTLRIWVPACSTGEEAYSIAILLLEQMTRLTKNVNVQIFATDINKEAIIQARTGFFSRNFTTEISPERLQRFFIPEPNQNGYHIKPNVRSMITFSEQNILKHPPFSRLDLISCRNLFIYLSSEMQEKLLLLFHYVLNTAGILFLGNSESIGEATTLFSTINRKANLFIRKEQLLSPPNYSRLSRPPLLSNTASHTNVKPVMRAKLPLKELTEQELLLQLAPSAALINSVGDILYLQGATGIYLEPVEGEPGSYNILKMAKEGLRIGLTTSLLKAIKTQEIVHCPHLSVKTNKHFILINLTIRPVQSVTDTPLFLVILEEIPHQDTEKKIDSTPEMAVLQDALLIQEEQLLILHNELNTINEELKSSNEELQANIEELQSTNEELETAQEESKSINDELISTNNAQQLKAIDLSSINNDMINLIAGTGIATVFVDLDMRVMRFTASSCEVINLLESDIGRSLVDITYHLLN